MARFPLRALGLLLLTVTIVGASCQALFADFGPTAVQAFDQIEQILSDGGRG